MTSQALVTTGGEMQEWELLRKQAQALITTGFLPAHFKTPEQVIAVIWTGQELGIPKMRALNSITVIQGKPTLSAELMAALIWRHHGDDALIVTESTPERCVISYKRKGWGARQQASYTIEDAKKAKIAGSQTWEKFPAEMLAARCKTKVARLAFSDVIGGLYAPEELEAEVVVRDDGAMEVIEISQPPRPNPHNANVSTGEIPARQLAAGRPAPQPQAPQVEQPRLCTPQQIEQYNALRSSWLAMDPQHSAKPANPQATAEQMAAGIAVLSTRIDRYEQAAPVVDLPPTAQLVTVGAPEDENADLPF